MKENSIEEDIKDIEKYISFTSNRQNFSHDTDWNWNKELANKIEHVLSDYKRVLKENEEVRVSNKKLYEIGQEMYKQDKYTSENYISKQIIKDKIEELKQEKKKYGNCLIKMYEDELVNRDIKILQELIEEREEKAE